MPGEVKAPFRPYHKRQNWFVKIDFFNGRKKDVFDPRLVKIETFRSSGPGGEHVNKTSTAVRAIYMPTGDTVVCSDERSQSMNKNVAIDRLRAKLLEKELSCENQMIADKRLLHYQLKRSLAVKSFIGKL